MIQRIRSPSSPLTTGPVGGVVVFFFVSRSRFFFGGTLLPPPKKHNLVNFFLGLDKNKSVEQTSLKGV